MRIGFRTAIVASAVLFGCERGAIGPHLRTAEPRSIVLEQLAVLDDDTLGILARPEWISELPDGRLVVADQSDKNLKLYAPSGRRVQTAGRVGRGPGEFVGLMTGQTFRDSLVGYDLNGMRLSFFGPDLSFARALTFSRDVPAPYLVRAVDDSLFLLMAAVPGAAGRDLLTLLRSDGSRVSSFFNPTAYLGGDPKLIQNTAVLADASGGVVFAALVGGDSLYAFDYAGRRLGAGPVDDAEPLVTTRELLERSGGREWGADGVYFSHGNRNVIALVALDSATVVLQVSAYDAVRGTDRLEGGTMIVATLLPGGGIARVARAQVSGALLGRDRHGRALVLQYTGPNAESYRLSRLVLGDAGEGAPR